MRNSRVIVTIVATAVAAAGVFAQESAGAKHKPGIYLAETGKGGEQLTHLMPSTAHSRTSGMGKTILTQGISKPHQIASLAGTGADVRVKEATPTFYFYFDTGDSPSSANPMAGMPGMMGSDGMPSGVHNAADFVLVKMNVTKDGREVDMGEAGSQSAKSKAAIDCVIERLAVGAYKVHAKDSLKSGEYAFYYNSPMGAGMGSSFWDFGIDNK